MKKKSFILVSMREDYFHNKSELRIGIDIKLIDWIIRIGFNPLLVSDLKTLNYFISQRLINIRGIVLSGGDLNNNAD